MSSRSKRFRDRVSPSMKDVGNMWLEDMSQLTQEPLPLPKKRLKYAEVYSLLALLPNGTSLKMSLDSSRRQTLCEFVKEMEAAERASNEIRHTHARKVQWGGDVFLEDTLGSLIGDMNELLEVLERGHSTIIVQDGHPQSQHFDKDLWNVTPEPEMLGRLPQGYNLETALADQVDNALQAVWDNKGCRRLVSVDVDPGKITIFDSGQGMDASQENSIAKWGTVGASTHRNVHHLGIGGDPPFLKPYLGKYGAGGVAAALHLGGKVVVSSKTRQSKKVVSLVIEKQILLEKHQHNKNKDESNARIWRTAGEFREMTEEEKQKAPHESFTCVEITNLKRHYFFEGGQQYWRVNHLRQLLKDIYALYIQSDQTGSSSKTIMPVEFQVNGVNLTEELGGEITLLNQHSCNGEPFIIDLCLKKEPDDVMDKHRFSEQVQSFEEANAQITCFYYPNLKGKEALESVLEKMADDLQSLSYTFESMPRVGIRWLGRLLPETKWANLPFMEVSTKKEKQGIRRQWARRVRAFIDTDAGFHPTQSKTALEGDHPFTVALQHLGSSSDALSRTSAFEVDVTIKLKGKIVSLSDLTEEYLSWLKYMHATFDEEVSFDDEPCYVINQENLEELLKVSKSVVVFHKQMKGASGGWKVDGQTPLRVKFQKGLGSRSDVYATVEYFFYDGTEEDHGEVKMVYRPLAVPKCEGSQMKARGGNCYFELNKSKWRPVADLNSDKCQVLTEEEWQKKVSDSQNKMPGHIEILNEEESTYFDVKEALPKAGSKFQAGFSLPKSFLVVVRPRKGHGPVYKQGMIVADSFEMEMSLSFSASAVQSKRSKEPEETKVSTCSVHTGERVLLECRVQGNYSKNGVKGLYYFKTEDLKLPQNLVLSGSYEFKFHLVGEHHKCVRGASRVICILPTDITSAWAICSHIGDCASFHPRDILQPVFRLNQQLHETLYLSKYDEYNNQQNFEHPMELRIALHTPMGKDLAIEIVIETDSIRFTSDKLYAKLTNFGLSGGKLHEISQTYNAVLRFYLPDSKTLDLNVKVLPGKLSSVSVKESYPKVLGLPPLFDEPLKPGDTIEKLVLQGYDEFGNEVDEGQTMKLELEGLELLDRKDVRQVDSRGCVNLEEILKVACPFNSKGCLSVLSEDGSILLEISFCAVTRMLQFVKKVPKIAFVGRLLEGVEVEVVDINGTLDASIEGPMNPLALSWDPLITCPLRGGRCTLPVFELPKRPGMWKGQIFHSLNPELKLEFQVEVVPDIVQKIVALPKVSRELKVLEAHNGKPFRLSFMAVDDHDQVAIIPKDMLEQFTLKIEIDDFGDAKIQNWKIKRGADNLVYEAELTIFGVQGCYKVLAECLDPYSRGGPRIGPIYWTLQLHPGDPVKLAPVIFQDWLPHELKEATSDPVKFMLLPRGSSFPVLDVYLLDSATNICVHHPGCKLAQEMSNHAQWVPKFTSVTNGHGLFDSFEVDLAVGAYELTVTTQLPNDPQFTLSLEAHITVQVTHGNYPSALKLLTNQPIVFNLDGHGPQYLPVVELLVETADGQPLRQECRPILRLADGTEYFADFVGLCSSEIFSPTACSQMVGNGHSSPKTDSKFSFSHVDAPVQAGVYSLIIYLPDLTIPPVSLELIVKHGPSVKIEFFKEKQGHEVQVLKVKIVDVFGNQCTEVSGIKLHAEIIIGTVGDDKLGPGIKLTNNSAVVENGEASFGEFKFEKGKEGMHNLRVFEEGNSLNLIAGSTQLIAVHKASDEIIKRLKYRSERLHTLGQAQNQGKMKIKYDKEKKTSLERSVTALQEELGRNKKQYEAVEKKQKAYLDFQTLENERSQVSRSEEDVICDFKHLANHGNGVPLAFWEATHHKNFLSPSTGKPAADEIIGQVVLLARVEGDMLNRILSEYIGMKSLLMIVCKSQQGIRALEAYDSAGNVDETKGLYEFARSRGRKISGRYQAICLTDIKAYRHPDGQDSVDLQHGQKLLRISPPLTSSGKPPEGFLGYAVNLLHLKDEHLQVSVKGRIVGLRETLFFHLFSGLQVYDTRKNLYHAKESCKQFVGGAVSLDGAIIRSNLRQDLGKSRDDILLRFPSLPFEHRIEGSLLPPVCHAFRRCKLKRELTANISTLEKQISSRLEDINNIERELVVLKDSVEEIGVQIGDYEEKVEKLHTEMQYYKEVQESGKLLDSSDDDTVIFMF